VCAFQSCIKYLNKTGIEMSNPQRLSTEKLQVVTQNLPRASAEGMQVVPDDSPEVFQKYDPSPELVPLDGQEEKILADVEE
jgi:hypothetical protein